MDFLLFMIVSVLEGIAIFYIACSLFRFRASDYFWKFAFIDVLICLVNYLLRNEELISAIAPLFSLVMLILFLQIFLHEVSLFWASVMAISGYAFYAVVQTIIVFTTDFIGIVTFQDVQERHFDGYILICSIAVLCCLFARYYYKKGRGFTFDFEKFKFAKENVLVILLIVISIIGFGIIFYVKQLLVAAVIFLIPTVYLIFFSIRRQKDDTRKAFVEHGKTT